MRTALGARNALDRLRFWSYKPNLWLFLGFFGFFRHLCGIVFDKCSLEKNIGNMRTALGARNVLDRLRFWS